MIRNILEYLERSESRYPDKTAFADEGASCTYAELKMRQGPWEPVLHRR